MKELIKDVVSIIKDMKEKDKDFTIVNCLTNFVLALAACSMIGTTVVMLLSDVALTVSKKQ